MPSSSLTLLFVAESDAASCPIYAFRLEADAHSGSNYVFLNQLLPALLPACAAAPLTTYHMPAECARILKILVYFNS